EPEGPSMKPVSIGSTDGAREASVDTESNSTEGVGPKGSRKVLPSTMEMAQRRTEIWALDVAPLPEEPAHEPIPPFEPLFVPLWTRAIVTASLSVVVEEGEIEAERIVESIARG